MIQTSNSCVSHLWHNPNQNMESFLSIRTNQEQSSLINTPHYQAAKANIADLDTDCIIGFTTSIKMLTIHIHSLTTCLQKQGLCSGHRSEYIRSPDVYLTLTLHFIWAQLLSSLSHYLWNQDIFFYMSQLRILCKRDRNKNKRKMLFF